MNAPRVTIIPPSVDLTDWSAKRILELHRAELPDLSRVTLLLPSWPAARSLRLRLTTHAGRGLLGPQLQTLSGFADSHAADGPVLSALDCRLLLTAALNRRRNLFPGQNAAQVADALFLLFEQMSANQLTPAAGETEFRQTLQSAYGATALPLLSFEAQLVHTLWHAFQTDSHGRSPATIYRQRLAQAFASLREDERVYLLGFDEFTAAECTALSGALRAGAGVIEKDLRPPALAPGAAQTQLWLQGRLDGRDGVALRDLCERLAVQTEPLAPENDARCALLNATFSIAPHPNPLPTVVGRGGEFPSPHVSFSWGEGGREAPGEGPLKIVEAAGPEHEVRCVELAVRQALLNGDQDVVVLTQDRRLARRLRALLERAGVSLHDPIGWALSTSSAAALLDAWLECLDQRFHFRPLLELLKSGFMDADANALQTLERELVYRHGIELGLERWLGAAQNHPALLELLQRVKTAAHSQPPTQTARPAQDSAAALLRALCDLGAESRLRQDAAGQKLIALLEQLQAAFQRNALMLDGHQFRALLNRAIETETFVPETAGGPVRLLTLEQSQGLRCDTLILAGASRDALPGAPPAEPFFNQSVRAELGLPGWPQRQSLGLARLRRVLESAPRILITYSAESAQEAAQLSPWIEALEFQAEACGLNLRDTELARLAGSASVEIQGRETIQAVPRNRPSPAAANDLLPNTFSASAHQTLLDCPYRFHAQYLLGLRAEQAPDEDADRSDYGRHVHRILEGYTQPVKGLPPPFESLVTPANRAQAHARLEQIAQAVFEPELRTRALALIWRAEFQSAMPALLDGLEQRGPLATVQAEVPLAKPLGPFTLAGKADRLETRADGTRVVVDYKTGRIPKRVEVESGEAVQLLHYAALDQQIASVEYWPLKDGERALVVSDELPELRKRAERRVSDLLQRVAAGAVLPAHGDEDTCEHCDYRGLCRKGDWADE